jgi:hypothetical protein
MIETFSLTAQNKILMHSEAQLLSIKTVLRIEFMEIIITVVVVLFVNNILTASVFLA